MSRLRRFVVPALLLLPLLAALSGCDRGRGVAYDRGYEEGFAAGHAEGVRKGEARGAADGAAEGRASAAGVSREDPAELRYLGPALWALLAGIGIGLVCQYIVLLDARDNGRVPSLVQTGLVPGMTSTLSYQLLERRWRLMARLDDWLALVARRRHARLSEIRTVRAVVAARINATSDLEELAARKYVALAGRELDRIVREAEEAHRTASAGPEGEGGPPEPSTWE